MSHRSLDFAVGRSELQKSAATNGTSLAGAVRLPRTWWGSSQVPHGAWTRRGQCELRLLPPARLAQLGAAVHAGAFRHGLALQGVWCWRNVLPVQSETREKLGAS